MKAESGQGDQAAFIWKHKVILNAIASVVQELISISRSPPGARSLIRLPMSMLILGLEDKWNVFDLQLVPNGRLATQVNAFAA